MFKKVIVAMGVVLTQAAIVCAAEQNAQAIYAASSIIAAALGVGIAACGCGIGMGTLVASELQGVARQPELTGKLQVNMMIGLAMIETLVLYALFIGIILLFANPFGKLFVQH